MSVLNILTRLNLKFGDAESPIWAKVGGHIYIKGVTDALVLTC